MFVLHQYFCFWILHSPIVSNVPTLPKIKNQAPSSHSWTSSNRCQAPLKSRSDFAPSRPDPIEKRLNKLHLNGWLARVDWLSSPQLLLRFNESSIRCPRTVCRGIALRPNPTILAWTNVCHSFWRCWWQSWWHRGPTVHGRNQLLKQSCWKKNIKKMQPSEIQMEPE